MVRVVLPQPLFVSASVAEKASGISMANQRDLRRRGVLPEVLSIGGKMYFRTEDLAEMIALRSVMNQGIAATGAVAIAKAARPHVAYWALREPGAVRDRSGGEASAIMEASDPPWLAADFLVKFEDGVGPRAFLIAWPDGTLRLCDDVNDALTEAAVDGTDLRTAGAAILLDMKALGKALFQRVGRHLAVLDVHDDIIIGDPWR